MRLFRKRQTCLLCGAVDASLVDPDLGAYCANCDEHIETAGAMLELAFSGEDPGNNFYRRD